MPRSASQVDLAWSPSTDNTRVAGYYVFRNGVKVGSPVGTSFADTGLSAETTYTYTVRAFDPAGQLSPPSASRTVTTLPSPDSTPPTPPGPASVYAFSATQLLVVWIPATDNRYVAGYRIYRNGTLLANSPIAALMDSNLSPATTYQYVAVAVDAAGNTSPPSAPVAGTTLPPPDRTPPSVPAAVKATAAARNRVVVTWGASTDNVRMGGYKVFRNGTLIAVVVTGPFTDVLALPNTTYTYTVSAFDAVGNSSAQSAGAVVTTPE
jgi:chitodextrinase